MSQELQSESVESVNFMEKNDFWQKKEEEEREKKPPKTLRVRHLMKEIVQSGQMHHRCCIFSTR